MAHLHTEDATNRTSQQHMAPPPLHVLTRLPHGTSTQLQHMVALCERTLSLPQAQQAVAQLTHTSTDVTYGAIARLAADLQQQMLAARRAVGRSRSCRCPVAIYAHPGLVLFAAVHACEALQLPFLLLDYQWPHGRVAAILGSSQSWMLICAHLPPPPAVVEMGSWQRQKLCQGLYSLLVSSATCTGACAEYAAGDPLYLMYTSGSTGSPMGVVASAAATWNRFKWMWTAYPFQDDDVCLAKTSIGFVDCIWELFGGFSHGIPLIVPTDHAPADVRHLVHCIHQERVTRLVLVPSLLRAMFQAFPLTQLRRLTHSLRLVTSSGESLPWLLAAQAVHAWPRVRLLNIYGCTETTADCACFDVTSIRPYLLRLYRRLEKPPLYSVPVGHAIPGVTIDLVADENGNSVVAVTGIGVALGYWGHPSDTPSPFKCSGRTRSHPRQFFTSDVGQWVTIPSSCGPLLQIVGRTAASRLVKIRGVRVHLDELEAVVSLDARVIACAAVTRQSTDTDGELEIVLFVVPARNAIIAPADVLHMPTSLLLPQAIPAAHNIRVVNQLPMTTSGKIDRRALVETLVQPEQTPIKRLRKLSFSEQSDFEGRIMHAFAQVIDAYAQLPGNEALHLNLFEAGGNSLNVVKALRHFPANWAVTFDMLVRYPSPAALRAHLLDRQSTAQIAETGADASITASSDSHIRDAPTWWLGRGGICLDYPGTSPTKCSSVSFASVWVASARKCVDAAPTIVGLQSGRTLVLIGSHAHLLLAIDYDSGAIVWQQQLPDRIEAPAAVHRGTGVALVGCYDGGLYAFDIVTGQRRWLYLTGGMVKTWPVVDDASGTLWCGSYDRHVHVLRTFAQRPPELLTKLECDASIAGGLAWDSTLRHLVVASTSGCVQCYQVSPEHEHNLAWTARARGPIFGTPAIDTATKLVILTSADQTVTARQLADGAIMWTLQCTEPLFSAPVIPSYQVLCATHRSAHACVFVGGHDGIARKLSLTDGTCCWQVRLGAPLFATPCYSHSNDVVCYCTTTGQLCLLRCADGTLLGQLDLQGEAFSSPIVYGSSIVIGSRHDQVVRVEFDTSE